MPADRRIDLTRIPDVDARSIGKSFLDAVMRFYDDPKNREQFEAWKASADLALSAAEKQTAD